MDKKGAIGLASIMFIIIALVSFGITANIAMKAAESSGKVSEGTACKLSLKIQATTEDVTLRFAEVDNICETMHKSIKVEEGDEYQLASFIAEKLARSYWIIYEGEDFSRDLWKRDGSSSGYKCMIMYVIDVEQKNRLGEDRPLELTREQFVRFLNSTTYPPKKNEGLTYTDYLTKNKNIVIDVLPYQKEGYWPFGLNEFASHFSESSAKKAKELYLTEFFSNLEEFEFDIFKNNDAIRNIVTVANPIVGLLPDTVTVDVENNMPDHIKNGEVLKSDESYAISICSHDQSNMVGVHASIPTMMFLTTTSFAQESLGGYYI